MCHKIHWASYFVPQCEHALYGEFRLKVPIYLRLPATNRNTGNSTHTCNFRNFREFYKYSSLSRENNHQNGHFLVETLLKRLLITVLRQDSFPRASFSSPSHLACHHVMLASIIPADFKLWFSQKQFVPNPFFIWYLTSMKYVQRLMCWEETRESVPA